MKFADKEFSYYWKIIKIPTFILIAWSVLGLIIAFISTSLYFSIFSAWAGWILIIAVFGFIGWTTVKDYKERTGVAAWAGALSGIVAGFAGGVLYIIMFYFTPGIFEITLQQAAQPGVDTATIMKFMEIWAYVGLITGPLLNAIVGAFVSAISALIARKV